MHNIYSCVFVVTEWEMMSDRRDFDRWSQKYWNKSHSQFQMPTVGALILATKHILLNGREHFGAWI